MTIPPGKVFISSIPVLVCMQHPNSQPCSSTSVPTILHPPPSWDPQPINCTHFHSHASSHILDPISPRLDDMRHLCNYSVLPLLLSLAPLPLSPSFSPGHNLHPGLALLYVSPVPALLDHGIHFKFMTTQLSGPLYCEIGRAHV